jgi:hypothetical protein
MTLDELIQDLRDELRAETPMRLHARAVPVLRDHDGITDRRNADEGGTGLPFSAAFHRYLAHPDAWGTSRLGMSSILEISSWCAGEHPDHRRPLFTRTVCADLAFQVGYLGQSVEDVVWLTGLSRPQVEGMLHKALGFAAVWRHRRLHAAMREARETERDTQVLCPECFGRKVVMRRTKPAA